MKKNKLYTFLLLALSIIVLNVQEQVRKPKNQPYADQKLYHLGFLLGFHTQDMIIKHTGYESSNGEVWFTEIPSYSPGFTVGMIADRYINGYLNLRVTPSLYFGENRFVFKEQKSGKEFTTTLRRNYISVPLLLKVSGERMDNFRPYFLSGMFADWNIGLRRGEPLRLNSVDYGLILGIGCNIYLPLFKLCPELRFSLGFKDLINKDRSDLNDTDLLKYTQAIQSGKARTVSLIFNFE